MKRKLTRIVSGARVAMLGGALIVALSSLAWARFEKAEDTPKYQTVALNVSDTPVKRDGGMVPSFAPIVKRVAPCVVKVNIETKAKEVPMPQSPFGDGDEFFRHFFGDQFGGNGGGNGGLGNGGRNGHSTTRREHGLGSGVIINKDGFILTNNHVVEDADTIQVTLTDGREFKAKVVGRDPKTDIAVVKIDAHNLPAATIGDSDKLEVGDICLAVGNPFGIGQTVTMGIISATGRANLGVGTDYEDFIQTDAAINPGNSGGALVDAEGRLIGINTAILSRSGGYQGIGFAVPINMARTVMEALIAHGKVVRGFMGVAIQDVTPGLEKQFNLTNDRGALVGDVTPNSPAAKAGLQSGDVIVALNNRPIEDSRHLKLQVAQLAPGTTVPVKIVRDGREKTVEVKLKELPGEEVASDNAPNDNGSDALKGVTVGDLTSEVRNELKVPENIKGAVVTQVEQDSVAAEQGLRQGDVIQEINRSPVNSADDAVRLTQHLKDKVVLLKIWTRTGANGQGASHYLVVDETKAQ
jgi:serine protease Do